MEPVTFLHQRFSLAQAQITVPKQKEGAHSFSLTCRQYVIFSYALKSYKTLAMSLVEQRDP